MISDLQKQRKKNREISERYRKNRPATVRVRRRRYGYLQKALMKWARQNAPELIKRFEREAIREFPSCLIDEDYPERGGYEFADLMIEAGS